VYVGDVVAANLLLTEASFPRARSLDDRGFNVGTGIETSVTGLADTLIGIAASDAPVEHAPARRGELRHSSLDATRLRNLGWAPRQGLEEGLRVTYEWIREQAAGEGAEE
jgi:UDP-glucose 4-epimerase